MKMNIRGNFYFVLFGLLTGWLLCSSWNLLPAQGSSADEIPGPVMLFNYHRVTKDGYFFSEADFAKDDEDWEKKSCPLKDITDINHFFDYIQTPRFQCGVPIMVGGFIRKQDKYPVLDGGKWVCMDNKFDVRPMNCRVLSFGISTDWSFDDEMDKKYDCKVYSFDPTIRKPDHNRSSNIQFFNLGISDESKTGDDIKEKVDRYVNIIKKLQLQNSVIDYLKMDVEGYERNFLQDVLTNTPNLLKNVKMIGMEFHLSTKGISGIHKTYWKQFQMLECLGFKVIFSEINPVRYLLYKSGKTYRSCCYEIVWARDRQW